MDLLAAGFLAVAAAFGFAAGFLPFFDGAGGAGAGGGGVVTLKIAVSSGAAL